MKLPRVGWQPASGSIDAPDFGEVVRVEPVYWSAFVGAVRIG